MIFSMKHLLIALFAAFGLSTAALAQGTVNFANVAGPATARIVDAPFFEGDLASRTSGPDWVAQLYAGPSALSLAAVGPAVPFLTGAGAGYFQGGTRVIPTVAPGNPATILVRAWRLSTGPTWETAFHKGETAPIIVTTGGVGSPPSLPANLVGLQSISIGIPEPSSLLLAGIGLLAILSKRFRTHTPSSKARK